MGKGVVHVDVGIGGGGGGTYGEAGGRGPSAVAGGADDGGFVDVAGADEAGGGKRNVRLLW